LIQDEATISETPATNKNPFRYVEEREVYAGQNQSNMECV